MAHPELRGQSADVEPRALQEARREHQGGVLREVPQSGAPWQQAVRKPWAQRVAARLVEVRQAVALAVAQVVEAEQREAAQDPWNAWAHLRAAGCQSQVIRGQLPHAAR